MSNLQDIKARFGIIGNYPLLNRALERAVQVAPTDISVLVIGESGVGKESIRTRKGCLYRSNQHQKRLF